MCRKIWCDEKSWKILDFGLHLNGASANGESPHQPINYPTGSQRSATLSTERRNHRPSLRLMRRLPCRRPAPLLSPSALRSYPAPILSPRREVAKCGGRRLAGRWPRHCCTLVRRLAASTQGHRHQDSRSAVCLLPCSIFRSILITRQSKQLQSFFFSISINGNIQIGFNFIVLAFLVVCQDSSVWLFFYSFSGIW